MPAHSLGGSSAWAVTSHTIQTITGAKTFEAADSATTPLTIVGAAGAAAPLLNINTSDGINRFKFETNGVFTSGYLSVGERIAGTSLSITTPSASTEGIVVRGAASQTASLQEWQDSAGNLLMYFHPGGHLYHIGTPTTFGRTTIIGNTDYAYIQMRNYVNPGVANSIVARYYYGAVDSAGAVITTGEFRNVMRDPTAASVDSYYQFYTMVSGSNRQSATLGDTGAGWNAFFDNFEPAARGLVVRGAASQTGNMLEIQNSAGARLTSITPGGIIQHEAGWTAATLINSWTNYDSTGNVFPHAQFRKDANGYVYIKGLIQGGASGTVAFVLPVGYRPRHSMHIPIIANGSTAYVRIGGIGETSPNAVQSPGAVSLTSLGGAVTTWSDIYSIPLFLAEG